MGNCMRSLLARLRKKGHTQKSITLLVVGLDNAGKTLVLNQIAGDPDKNVLPTMGFHTVTLRHKDYEVKIYDIGGSSQIRGLWPKYYSGIHGLIYVVDASDISRLTENKVVFSELVSHEHISGKPLLLLANKQDVNGAIDELDLVENLDVERVANAMRCPTRVETCSCIYEREHLKDSTMGIRNGYKWLLDTITNNYTALDNRIKNSQSPRKKRISERHSAIENSPSKLSVHSNPFKPIQQLLSKHEEPKENKSQNGEVFTIAGGTKKLRKIFTPRNKTAPIPTEQSVVKSEDISEPDNSITVEATQKSTQTVVSILDPLKLPVELNGHRPKLNRPHTAPECSRDLLNKMTVINIPGQVIQ